MKTGHPAYISLQASWYHWNLIAELSSGGEPRHIVTTSAYTLVVSYCAGNGVRDACVRPASVMAAGREEQ